jgi:splicing suppressor protein 51
MEAALKGTMVDDTMHLIPCPECKLSFCCSRAHWEIADRLHYGPWNDLRDSPSQCYMNKLAHGQSMIAASFLDASGHLVWFPDRVKPKWVSLEGQSWEGEFNDEIRKFSRMPQSTPSTFIMAAISDTLTMPMTILYALSKLRDGDGWTWKQTMMVHVRIFFSPGCLGASEPFARSSVPAPGNSAAAVPSKKFCIALPK